MRILRQIVLTGGAVALTLPVAQAQDTGDFEARINEATLHFNNDDIEKALVALQAALIAAETPEQKLSANRDISAVFNMLEDYPNSIAYAENCLNILDASAIDDLESLRTCSQLKSDGLIRSGRRDEAVAFMTESQTISRGRIDGIVWSGEEYGITHIQSGFHCPDVFDDFALEGSSLYDPMGGDVGCSYESIIGPRVVITTYVTYQPGRTADIVVAGYDEILERNFPNPKPALDAEIIGEWDGPELKSNVISYTANNQTFYSGVWAAHVSGWTYKTRITWPEQLGAALGSEITSTFLTYSQDSMDSLQSTCSVDWSQFEGQIVSQQDSFAGGIFSGLMMSGDELGDDINAEQRRTLSKLTETGCFAGSSNNSREVLYFSNPERPVFWTHKGGKSTGVIIRPSPMLSILSPVEVGSDDVMYEILKITDGPSIAFYGQLDGTPRPAAALSISAQIAKGATPLSITSFDESGQPTITITAPPEE